MFSALTYSRLTGNDSALICWYDKGIDWIFSHKIISLAFIAVTVLAVYPLFKLLDTERMPDMDASETIVSVDWNENINLDENNRRVRSLLDAARPFTVENSAFVGTQDFMLGDENDLGISESEIYLRTVSPDSLDHMKHAITAMLSSRYPDCSYEFLAPDNVFEKVFSSDEPDLEARLLIKSGSVKSAVVRAADIRRRVAAAVDKEITNIPLRRQINLSVDHELLAIYNVDYSEVHRVLQAAFSGTQASTLRSNQDYIPVKVVDRGKSVEEVLATTLVNARPDSRGNIAEVPLKALVKTSWSDDFKNILSDEGGEYVPMAMEVSAGESGRVINGIRNIVADESELDVSFTGSLFSNSRMMGELIVILLVSLLMMYFILCAQLESFVQPLVVLLEIPVDVAFALVSLWICGQTLNLMSAIGIIVTCGIVVNDSILKLDAINELRKTGMPLLPAIHTAGRRRLKPIIMTSLTTIFAMVPVLFTNDMGSELQRPLAVAMIGSMIVGTLVSIFIIPLIYYMIYNRKQ